MYVPLAPSALDEILNLPLVRITMKLTIVSFTVTVDGRLTGQQIVVHQARVICRVMDQINLEFVMKVGGDCLIEWLVRVADGLHL